MFEAPVKSPTTVLEHTKMFLAQQTEIMHDLCNFYLKSISNKNKGLRRTLKSTWRPGLGGKGMQRVCLPNRVIRAIREHGLTASSLHAGGGGHVISFESEAELWSIFESIAGPNPSPIAIAVREAPLVSGDAYRLWEFFQLKPAGGIC
jgi:hypothetical protein